MEIGPFPRAVEEFEAPIKRMGCEIFVESFKMRQKLQAKNEYLRAKLMLRHARIANELLV
ncbi:MAG: hypothetical protein P4M11_00160 [Candidatus Pacebacteria bacterium]|nr:hypothetical protein [Candidatus Paceibacterota bacterium]